MKKASKLLVLEFINKREIVTPLDLMNRFGYSRGGASWMLTGYPQHLSFSLQVKP